MTPEREKEFWKSMKECHVKRKDGQPGECCDVQMHNRGCWGCTVGSEGVEPPAKKEEQEE